MTGNFLSCRSSRECEITLLQTTEVALGIRRLHQGFIFSLKVCLKAVKLTLSRNKQQRLGSWVCHYNNLRLRLFRLLELSPLSSRGSLVSRASIPTATTQKAPIAIELRSNSIFPTSSVDTSTLESSLKLYKL
jgi:hypothetical protein